MFMSFVSNSMTSDDITMETETGKKVIRELPFIFVLKL